MVTRDRASACIRLTTEQLTPFVSSRTSENMQTSLEAWEPVPEPMTGEAYLQRWKAEGGHDVVDVPAYHNPTQKQTNMPEVWEQPAKKSDKTIWQK